MEVVVGWETEIRVVRVETNSMVQEKEATKCDSGRSSIFNLLLGDEHFTREDSECIMRVKKMKSFL